MSFAFDVPLPAFCWELHCMASHSAPAPLTIFDPNRPRPAEPTLRLVWEKHLAPAMIRRKLKPGTLKGYERALKRWDRYREHQKTSPNGLRDTLPIEQGVNLIGRADLAGFQTYLEQIECCGARTVNKSVEAICKILKVAAEEELIGSVPSCPDPLLGGGKPLKLRLSHDQLNALYQACEIARWPKCGPGRVPLEYSPCDGWRMLIVWMFFYGFRTGDLIQIKPDAAPVTWGQITGDRESPAEDGQAINDHGWFWYVPSKQESFKPDPLVLPITEVARRHLDMVRPASIDPAMPLLNWPRGNKQFYKHWDRLIAEAGIKAKPNLTTGKRPDYEPKHLRKTCVTELNNHRRGIAPLIVGHDECRDAEAKILIARRENNVERVHYDNAEDAILEALTTLPIPSAFLG